MNTKLQPFDMADYLDSDESIAEYLTQVLSDGDQDELLCAIGHVAKARGMAQIAKEAGLGRESLYKTFAQGAKPRFETVSKVIKSLGFNIQISPKSAAIQ